MGDLVSALSAWEDPQRELRQILSVIIGAEEAAKGSLAEPQHVMAGEGCFFSPHTAYVRWRSGPSVSERVGELAAAVESHLEGRAKRHRPRRLVVLAPLDSVESVPGIKAALEPARLKVGKACALEVWSQEEILAHFARLPPLALHYLPELIEDGLARKARFTATRKLYDQELAKLYGKIQFVGMSVYKEEASAGVALEKIYIPLRVVPEGATSDVEGSSPLELLGRGERHVILGDPGSGKSTLLKFIALAGQNTALQARYGARQDARLPILVTLRRFADELKSEPDLSLLGFAVRSAAVDFDLRDAGRDLFEFYLYAGQAVVLLDGIDELPGTEFKKLVREKTAALLATYPGNSVLATSRIVGYEAEARFEGFSHHVVGKLNLPEIEAFVKDWYAARIENKPERERHAGDLIRVVRDPDSQALRDLAQNPLLLTITCLVHRIDAVLPDERVVLYEKCTETLLNSWHAWKFKTEEIKSRNKVERRNRSRMEALAFWMHSLLAAEEAGKRAVVPHEQILAFLSQYIEEVERADEPQTLAKEFLRFVKERAGLLIEAGPDLYSFVHLTFQEYLAATHLRKSGEMAGVGTIWDSIAEKCGDSRWHEVLRLLVGALEKLESQEYLLVRILDSGDKQRIDRAVLAGGCLLDSVDAAEEMREEIVNSLLSAAVRAESVEALRKSLRVLQSWQEKELENRQLVKAVAARFEPRSEPERAALYLTLVCLGWEGAAIREARPAVLNARSEQARLLFAFGLQTGAPTGKLSPKEATLVEICTTSLSQSSPMGNLYSVLLAGAVPQGSPSEATPSFRQVLSSLLGLGGPFNHQLLYVALSSVAKSSTSPEHNLLARTAQAVWTRDRDRDRDQGLDLDLARDLARARDLDLALDRARARDLDLALDRARARARALDRALDRARARDRARDLALALDRALARDLDLAWDLGLGRDLGLAGSANLWASIEGNPSLHGPLLDLTCGIFLLSPRPHWWEALRVHALPKIPSRLNLASPELWSSTIARFEGGQYKEADCETAAAILLVDVWLWVNRGYEEETESPLHDLAGLTRAIDAPPLQVAHCIRDIAFGREERVSDLRAMLKADDPDYRRMFEAAFWRDPEETREQPPPKRRKWWRG